MTDRETSAVQEAKLHFLDYWRVIRLRLPIIILAFLLVVVTAGVTTYFLPRQYQSNVIIEVEQNEQKIRIFTEGYQGAMGMDPRFATTQFQIIQRKEMLYPVIDAMNLVERWSQEYGIRSKEQAYFKLRSMIDVREVRNTNLLQISVESTDPQESSDLANSIAQEYQRKRIEEQQKLLAGSLATLEDEVSKQRKKVQEANEEMGRIRTELGITDLNPDSLEDPMQSQETVLQQQEQLVSEARTQASNLRTKYNEIEKLTGDELMRSLPTLEIEDQTIATILPQYQEISSELARALQSGLGARHPTILSLQAKKSTYEQQLTEQVNSIRRTLAANLQITERSMTRMQEELEKSRTDQRESKTRGSEYARAKKQLHPSQESSRSRRAPTFHRDHAAQHADEPGSHLGKSRARVRPFQAQGFAQHGARRDCRIDPRDRSGLLSRIPRHQREDDGGRRKFPPGSRVGCCSEEHRLALRALRCHSGCRGLSHPAHQP